jgi:SAM-dependent methyltransferase
MPVYRTRRVFEAARGVKFFLKLDAGVTRGQVPQDDTQAQKSAEKRIRDLQGQLHSAREELNTKKQLSEIPKKHKPAPAAKKSQPEKPRLEKPDKQQDGVFYDGILLPPPRLRPTKRGKMGEEIYFEATREEVDWMVENLGLSSESSMLDLGCGSGRIALGILDRVGEIREYQGVDVDERFLGWPQEYITPKHPNFQFTRLDLQNDYYNPQGEKMAQGFALPFADGEFDIICLFSVFTHMLTDDVRIYLEEFYRVLQPEGKVFMTANLEDGVPDVTENPVGYRGRYEYNNPLATVRYNREFFENLLEESGFRLEGYDHPPQRTGQDCVTVSKR